jgi:hypothetical protein
MKMREYNPEKTKQENMIKYVLKKRGQKND